MPVIGNDPKMILKPPLPKEIVKSLKLGDTVWITGEILVLRDRAHERLLSGQELPIDFDFDGSVIYHCCPLIDKSGGILSAGPTTSARLNPFTPSLLKKHRIRAIIGKGGMDAKTREAMKKYGCVYLAYPGGCGVIAANQIKKQLATCWEDLGYIETVRLLDVEGFGPLIVAIDSDGKSLYEKVQKEATERIDKMMKSRTKELESLIY